MSNNPFADGALRPTNSNATSVPSALRNQASQTSLRSGAGSAASNRARQTRDLFAPSLSRRAPSRALRHIGDDVLADSDSERDNIRAPTAARLRRVRRMSPDLRHSKLKQKQEEDVDIVHRRPDGNFIHEIAGEAEALREHLNSQELVDEVTIKAIDDEYVAKARQYFTSGASIGNIRGRKHEEEFEEYRLPMLAHLRTQVLQKLEDERWRFEPTTS